MKTSLHFLCASVALAGLALSAPAGAQDTGAYLARAAHGDITQPGGARRLADGDASERLKALVDSGEARNVILFIGDGMGDSEITIARNYAEGAGGFFKGIDALPITGQYTHYSLDRKTGKPDYVTDSAASGTAWATGVKTYNNAVGVDVHGRPEKNLIELAKASGLATGDVSTAEIQDATPAVLLAHVALRKCYGPEETSKSCPEDALEKGGLGSISEQILNTRADLVLGGGAKSFDQKATAGDWKGMSLLDQAKERGFNIVTNLDEMDALIAANQDEPVLGLFAPGNMPVRWIGPKASYHGNIDGEPVTCQPNVERPAAMPTLAAMTRKAIDLLKSNHKGFFLQVEGASIDKQDHEANPCGQIGETVDLDEAVQAALAFARTDGKTLVIVTADHAHSSQIIPNGTKAPGLTQALMTRDGAVMSVSYGNSEGASQEHTGAQLRVAGFGPRAANFAGLTDQTDMFFTIRDALKLGESQRAQAQ
jgi:alkaline phosphatase